MKFGVQQKKNQFLTPTRLETAKKNLRPVKKVLQNNNASGAILVVNFFLTAVNIRGKKFNLSNLQKCPYLKNPLSSTHDLLGIIAVYKEGSGKIIWISGDESN